MSEARHLPAAGDPVLARLPVAAVAILLLANIFFIFLGERIYELEGLSEYAFMQIRSRQRVQLRNMVLVHALAAQRGPGNRARATILVG